MLLLDVDVPKLQSQTRMISADVIYLFASRYESKIANNNNAKHGEGVFQVQTSESESHSHTPFRVFILKLAGPQWEAVFYVIPQFSENCPPQ